MALDLEKVVNEFIEERQKVKCKKLLEIVRFTADRDFRNVKEGQKCMTLYADYGDMFIVLHMLDEGQNFEGDVDIAYTKCDGDGKCKKIRVVGAYDGKEVIYETTEYQLLTVGR